MIKGDVQFGQIRSFNDPWVMLTKSARRKLLRASFLWELRVVLLHPARRRLLAATGQRGWRVAKSKSPQLV